MKESIHVPFICLSVMFLLSAWIHTSVYCVFQKVFLLFWTNHDNNGVKLFRVSIHIGQLQSLYCIHHLLKRTWYVEMHTKTNIEILSVRKVITNGVNLMRSLNDIDNLFKSSYEKTYEITNIDHYCIRSHKVINNILCRIFTKQLHFYG